MAPIRVNLYGLALETCSSATCKALVSMGPLCGAGWVHHDVFLTFPDYDAHGPCSRGLSNLCVDIVPNLLVH